MSRFALLLLLVLPTASTLADDRPGYLPREVRAALLPGLRAEFRQGPLVDVRRDRLPNLFVAPGSPPTPFLEPKPFTATYAGYLRLRIRGDFEFELVGRGRATLSINGEKVCSHDGSESNDEVVSKSEKVSLLKGYNTLRLDYESPQDGAENAVVRVYWTGADFPREPLPVDRLWCDGRDVELQTGLELRQGRELFATRLCSQCHRPEVDPHLDTFTGMPDLAHDAPSLADAANRLEPAWVATWLRDPAALRNEVSMPSLLHGLDDASAKAAAADIAAYLGSLKIDDPPAAVEAIDEFRERGELLYETRGCIACHRFTPPDEEDEADRLSLHFVAAKYRPGALAAFLRDSRAHYEWSRMPKFDFDANDSAALEVFLRDRSKGAVPEVATGDADLGRERTTKLGCVQCHAENNLGPARSKRAAIDLAKLATGCLSPEPTSAPEFRFDDDDRGALAAFLKHASRTSSLERVVPAEFAERTIRSVNCTACHARDDADAALPLLAADEGELGLLPDPIPSITWAGEKLYPSWSRELFAGKLGYRLRDHFRARMPAFPARGDVLADGLSEQHGFDPREEPKIAIDDDLAGAGEAIAAPQVGLSCIRCHPIGEDPPTAPEQARSTNLSFTRRRMRHEFYTRWMLFPQRVEFNTRMIRFAPDGQLTGLDEIYEGDARQQFEAIWHYLGRLHEEERERAAK